MSLTELQRKTSDENRGLSIQKFAAIVILLSVVLLGFRYFYTTGGDSTEKTQVADEQLESTYAPAAGGTMHGQEVRRIMPVSAAKENFSLRGEVDDGLELESASPTEFGAYPQR